ncbi:MAG: DUF4126 domain-containing protein [Vulcanimicrobiaceae bacterium]
MDATGFATAYGLSTAAGLRPFLVLALASLAMHLGYVHPAHAFAYLGQSGATWLLGALAALEFAGDKIPVLDHTLQAMHFATKPIAAALLAGSIAPGTTVDGTTPALDYALMGGAALSALGVHAGVVALRGASTTMTLGAASPFVSVVEDALALGGTLLAFAVPYLAAALSLALGLACAFVVRTVVVAVRARRGRRVA